MLCTLQKFWPMLHLIYQVDLFVPLWAAQVLEKPPCSTFCPDTCCRAEEQFAYRACRYQALLQTASPFTKKMAFGPGCVHGKMCYLQSYYGVGTNPFENGGPKPKSY